MINILTISLGELHTIKNESIITYGKNPIFIISQKTKDLLTKELYQFQSPDGVDTTLCGCKYAIADWLSIGEVVVTYEV
jgi:hypothetical protein